MDLNIKFAPVMSAFMQSNARSRFILGPFGSGKSVGCQIEVPRRGTMQRHGPDGFRRARFAVIRNTMPQLRDTTMKTWFDWFPNGSIGYYKETGKTYFIEQEDMRVEVCFRALDDAADVKNLLSLELTGGYINEFRDIPREIVEALDGRIGRYPRKVDGGPSWTGIWGDSNMPEEDTYWYCMAEGLDPADAKTPKPNDFQFFRQPPGMIKTIDGQYIPNPEAENRENLPDDYYERLVKDKDPDFIRWVVMMQYARSKGGRPVHPSFNRDLHVARQTLIPNRQLLLLVAADFGLTPAMTLKQQDAFGRVLTLDEVVSFGSGLERAIEEKLLPLLRQKYDGFEIFVTGDPSGDSGAQTDEQTCADIFRNYRRKGLGKVKFAPTNSPAARQGAMDHFLQRLDGNGLPAKLIDPSCRWLIQGLGGKYQFKKTKDGRHSEDVDKNDWSHVCEADEYGDMYYERGGRRKANLREQSWDEARRAAQASTNSYAMPR